MNNLVNKVGSIGQDNLIAREFPRALTFGIKIAAGEGEVKRGTVLCAKDDGTYTTYGGEKGTTPAAILTADVDATGDEDVAAVAYHQGNFNPAEVTVAEGYTLTAADKDTLRKYSIVFTQMLEA